MAVGINDFWKLAVRSGVVTSEQAHLLQRQFADHTKATDGNGNAKKLAQWLIDAKVLSRYQARVLLKGLAGPFRFGDFRVADRVPDRRFKQTFRAVHSPTGHPVALRFYDASVVSDESMWPAIAQAVRQLSTLKSARVHRYYQWCEQDKYRFAVMEDFSGKPLSHRLEESGPLDWETACRVVRQVAEALAEIRTLQKAHGDIRPENIWLTDHGCVHLMIEPIDWMTPVSLIVNTPLDGTRLDYLAPELTVAGHAPDLLTDLYALGCTLYELLAGKPPFAEAEGAAKIERHVKTPPASLVEQGVPAGVYAVVETLMAKNPPLRVQSTEDLIERINQLVPTSDPLPIPGASQAEFEQAIGAADAEAPPELPTAVSGETPPSVPSVLVPESPVPRADDAPLVEPGGPPVVVDEPVEAPLVIGDSSSPTRRRRRRRKSRAWIGWFAAALLLAAGAYFVYPSLISSESGDSEEAGDGKKAAAVDTEGKSNKSGKTGTSDEKAEPKDEPSNGPALVDDDGKTLWADPLEGKPISLAYLPPGGQCFIACRPADLDAAEAATKFQAALGPRWKYYREQWESLTKIPWKDIDQLVISFAAGEGGAFPRPALVAYLASSPGEAALIQRWGNPPAEAVEGKRVYALADWQVYLPADQEGKVVVLGSPQQIKDVIEFDGAPPVVLRQLTRLLSSSNDRHHVTVLAVPGFLENSLFRDDFHFYFGDSTRVRDMLASVLIEEVTAFRMSVALGDPVYVELRLNVGSAPDAASLLKTQRERLGRLAEWSEDRLSSVVVPEYWRRVAMRYPQMLRFLDQYLRAGVEGRELVFNAVLPAVAPANLLVGAEMMLLAGQTAGTAASKEPEKKTPKSMEELLQAKMSMMFDQTSLDFAVKDLEAIVKDEFPDLGFPFAIKILGGDLQLNGITQNQQIVNFRQEDKTLSEILTAIVMKANPITTVKKPSEMDQKLIWVVAPDPANADQRIILITTRDAAESRKYELPKPFVP